MEYRCLSNQEVKETGPSDKVWGYTITTEGWGFCTGYAVEKRKELTDRRIPSAFFRLEIFFF